ncbi:MAG: cellulase family glycosylhydrolase [Deltaproteobacteria bacterium]|nr:cellulase family glycosylhydrolase [Deltaproteobacteria bacterium]MBN2671035.1 cellulase family glycosylhydrolase [Deltaproteobacteria bacterium]
MTFLQVVGDSFYNDHLPVRLRSVGLGNWLNLEHFMLGIPGTESQIRTMLTARFGEVRAQQFWNAYYRKNVSEKDLMRIASLGFNSVRVPVNHHLFFDADEVGKSTAVREIDRILPFCRAAGLWVILDMHTSPGGQNPDWHSDNVSADCGFWKDESAQNQIVELWGDVAKYYREEECIAGFDLLNEPCYLDSAYDAVLVEFYAKVIASVRRYDKNHIVFLEGNTYARDFSMFQNNIDENLAYSFHFYPFLQVGDVAVTANNAESILSEALNRDVSYRHLRETLRKPLWCGETGHLHAKKDYLFLFYTFVRMLETDGVSWSLWPYKDVGPMGLVTLPPDGNWVRTMAELSENWNFFEFFKQDSFIAMGNEVDSTAYYRRMADFSTDGLTLFAENLKKLSFEQLIEFVDEFDHPVASGVTLSKMLLHLNE